MTQEERIKELEMRINSMDKGFAEWMKMVKFSLDHHYHTIPIPTIYPNVFGSLKTGEANLAQGTMAGVPYYPDGEDLR